MGRRDRDAVLPKTHPQHGSPLSRGISQMQSFSLESEEFMPHFRHSYPWGLCQRDEPQKHLALKTKGLVSRKHKELQGTEILPITCLHADSLAQEPSTKLEVWKEPKPSVMGIHLLILKCLLKGQGPDGTLWHCWAPFCTICALSFYIATASRYVQSQYTPVWSH